MAAVPTEAFDGWGGPQPSKAAKSAAMAAAEDQVLGLGFAPSLRAFERRISIPSKAVWVGPASVPSRDGPGCEPLQLVTGM